MTNKQLVMSEFDWPSSPDQLRVKCWYMAVKGGSGFSDYQLDQLFAKDEDNEFREIDRLRLFEKIRKNLKFPIKGSEYNKENHLVARVSQFEGLEETQEIANAQFWETLKDSPANLAEAQAEIDRYLVKLGIRRITEPEAKQWRIKAASNGMPRFYEKKDGNLREYSFWLSKTLEEVELSLNKLGLLAALYREACLGYRHKYAEVLAIELEDCAWLLGTKKEWLLPSVHFFTAVVCNRFILGRMDYWPSRPVAKRYLVVADEGPDFVDEYDIDEYETLEIATPEKAIEGLIVKTESV